MFLEEGPKGIYYNITTYGLSLLYSPFFLSAHAYATIANAEPTGYSPPYKFALMLSCVFYLALGLYFLLKLLMKYFPPWPTAITLIVIALGTNLYYYSTHEALMPHAYLFALISIFLYMGDRWYEKTDLKNSLILGFIIGLIILIRPVNIIILLLFILWGVLSWRSLITRILFLIKSYKWILLMILVTFMIWVPQFLYWKYISGNYLFYTYSDQRFFFSHPQWISSLFSYRKGLFLYFPLLLIACCGIPFLYKKYRGLILPVSLFILLNIYVLSSWCFWWFGGGFGPRSYIDTYSVMAFPFAALTTWFIRRRIWFKIPYLAVIAVLVWFNFFQTAQYSNGAINWIGMTREAYWNSFLRKYPTYEYWQMLRYPDPELAKKGIYYQGDLTYKELSTGVKSKQTSDTSINIDERERYIKNLDKFIRTQKEWFDQEKEKAELWGISVDSVIRKDAIWLYGKEMEKKRLKLEQAKSDSLLKNKE